MMGQLKGMTCTAVSGAPMEKSYRNESETGNAWESPHTKAAERRGKEQSKYNGVVLKGIRVNPCQ
jgi:hypothetical protein